MSGVNVEGMGFEVKGFGEGGNVIGEVVWRVVGSMWWWVGIKIKEGMGM